jgi:RimJ/RimL family protein N-acetyltransferase
MILQHDDLRLRPVRISEDIDAAVPWYSDPEVLHFSEGPGTSAYDRDTVERMLRYLAEHGDTYIIEVLEAGQWLPIGDAAVLPDSLPIVIGSARHRSRGLGRRVLRLLIERATALGWQTLTVGKIFEDNERSFRLYEGAGFVRQKRDAEPGEPVSWRLVLTLPTVSRAE